MPFSNDTQASIIAVLPEILMTTLALLVLAVDLWWPEDRRVGVGAVAGGGLLLISGLLWTISLTPDTFKEQMLLGGMIRHDEFTQIFRAMVIMAGGLSCLVSMGVDRLRDRGDYYAILIVSVIGASLMSAAADLIMVFLALETTSITLYMLAGYLRDDDRSTEAGLKYFLFGAFTSAFTLYGLSLLYGFTGETNIYALGQVLAHSNREVSQVGVVVALGLVVVGFGFKISAVPFHFWTPDVYEGAPTPITALLSTASKAASFGLLLRFLLAVFPPASLLGGGSVQDTSEFWVQLMAVLATVTMTLGNLLALAQSNIKRLLAYSSIAQAGYTLIGVAAIATDKSGDGAAAVAFYMFMYVLTNILAFGVVIVVSNAIGSDEIRDLAGLSRRNAWLALGMVLALISLGGIPPAAGFVGKFLLFRAAVNADLIWLALVGIINVIISLYYYLTIVKVMYVDRGPNDDVPILVTGPYRWALGIAAAGVVLFGTVMVSPLLDWATEAAKELYVML
ncbi:MAG TPA: NADH-quinone oxidoreductase subunit N [Aggregatilineaceae bacterium]|nr:NADH-quinone oxidoreductase subunit N [Aggregatilineaceae bacterium]